jgi:hypothetical protein
MVKGWDPAVKGHPSPFTGSEGCPKDVKASGAAARLVGGEGSTSRSELIKQLTNPCSVCTRTRT